MTGRCCLCHTHSRGHCDVPNLLCKHWVVGRPLLHWTPKPSWERRLSVGVHIGRAPFVRSCGRCQSPRNLLANPQKILWHFSYIQNIFSWPLNLNLLKFLNGKIAQLHLPFNVIKMLLIPLIRDTCFLKRKKKQILNPPTLIWQVP